MQAQNEHINNIRIVEEPKHTCHGVRSWRQRHRRWWKVWQYTSVNIRARVQRFNLASYHDRSWLVQNHLHHEHNMHLNSKFENQIIKKLNNSGHCMSQRIVRPHHRMFSLEHLHRQIVVRPNRALTIIRWIGGSSTRTSHAHKWGVTCEAPLAPQARPPTHFIEKQHQSTYPLTLTLSPSLLFIPLTLSTLSRPWSKKKQGEGEGERLEDITSSKKTWSLARSCSPQEVGDRRGKSPLSLTILELGGDGAIKKEPEEPRVGSSFSITLRSSATTPSNSWWAWFELKPHFHGSHCYSPRKDHQWPRCWMHTM